MYRLIRFLIVGVWQMPEPTPPHRHKWEVLQEGATTYGPVTTLQCAKCGDCKIIR